MERTCDALKDASDTYARIMDKIYDGDLALLKDFENVKTRAQHVLAKNRAWLDIDDEKRANENNLEDVAIYYDFLTYETDQNGNAVRCVLDLEKAEKKLAERGY